MRTPLLRSPDTLQVNILNCDVEERNVAKKENFSMLWEDLTMEIRRQERTTLLEWNSFHREKYEKQQQDTILVQRSPSLKIQMGRLGEKMKVYRLPYKNVLPVPLFKPSKLPSKHNYAPEGCQARNGSASEKEAIRQMAEGPQSTKPGFQISSLLPQQNIWCPTMH
ncbi:telethonin-like [Lacerta agilis]|uniref:telethonin-like n=1 Tax=Lacerta agilis TaxID=80427 RepID=UPI0014199712|nr:telethonin-like [Lacerta agilis]